MSDFEHQQSNDRISELTRVHETLNAHNVAELLRDLHRNAERPTQELLTRAINDAIEHPDSSHVALAFKGFAEKVREWRQHALNIALNELVAELNFGKKTHEV